VLGFLVFDGAIAWIVRAVVGVLETLMARRL